MSAKPSKTQFIGHWVNWTRGSRIEQWLSANGKFEASVFAEDYGGALYAEAKGLWEIVGKAIHWRYTWSDGITVPKKVDINPILRLDANHFTLREPTKELCSWYRAVKSAETSANFDFEELAPFLKRISRHITSGFKAPQISALLKKVRRLKPDKDADFVFPIKFQGDLCPFYIRVFMDDISSPDVSLYAPVKLTRLIEKEMKR